MISVGYMPPPTQWILEIVDKGELYLYDFRASPQPIAFDDVDYICIK